jgi:tRNA(Ile2) C34 agmatinyltransferase TiaS
LIARALRDRYPLVGVTRHQLLLDPRVPYTAKNSSAAVLLRAGEEGLHTVLNHVREIMLRRRAPGSDPGLAIASEVPAEVIEFGSRVKTEVLDQVAARELARRHRLPLLELAGTGLGIIGALAAVGLAASGEDGRYVMVGSARLLRGPVPTGAVLEAGVESVRTLDGQEVTDGTILAEKLRPARRAGGPVLFVRPGPRGWIPLKVD